MEKIQSLKEKVEKAGLKFEVIESVPVHEDIRLGLPTRERYIENYKKNRENLAKAGVKVICYNFMPVFDWTRSQLDKELEMDTTALVYYKDQVDKLDPLNAELSLPGWDSSYTKEEMATLFAKYKEIGERRTLGKFKIFLRANHSSSRN